MGKHLSEDRIQYVVDVQTSKAQQAIHQLEKESAALRSENRQRMKQMLDLEAAGKKETEQYKNLSKAYKETSKQISSLTQDISKQTKSLDVNAMSMAQLKKQSRDLQRELDSISKALNPKAYDDVNKRLKDVNGRINSLKLEAKSWKETVVNDSTMSFMSGTLMAKGAELIAKWGNNIRQSVDEGIEMAKMADGVSHAFERIDNPNILTHLRKATKGTINDFELMKATVKAKDFRIPLEDLGKYLAFAQLKAQQTGQSFDYMVESIITGLGRESKMILDNLGISANEIDEKVAETGSFMKAVASIVDKQMAEAGDAYVSAADRSKKKTVELENAQLRLGQALLPWKESYQYIFSDFRINLIDAIVWLIKHKEVTAAMIVATIGFTVAMTVLNTEFKLWVSQLKIAHIAMAGWNVITNTTKGVTLLFSAAIATLQGNSIRAAAAMKLFNSSCRANVIVAVATAVIAAGVALYAWIKRNNEAKRTVVDFMSLHRRMAEDIRQQNKNLKKSAADMISDEITKVKMLRKTINDNNESYAKRKDAISALQKIVPGYHATLNGEGKLFAQNTRLIDTYIKKLNQAAMAEAAYEQLKANNRRIIQAKENIRDAKEKIGNVKTNSKKLYDMDFDKMNIQDDGYVRYNDAHRDDDPRLLDETKMNYKWDPGIYKEQIRNNQNFISARTEVMRQEEAVVAAYSKQNDRLMDIIKQNGGVGQGILKPTFINKDVSTTGDKVGEEQKSIFKNERKEALSVQEHIYNKSMEIQRKHLAEKRITQEEYNALVTAIEMAHSARILDIEKEYTSKAKELKIKDANEKQEIVLSQQENEEAARRNFEQKHLEVIKQYYEAKETLEKSAMSERESQEVELQLQLRSLKAYYDTALDYANKHGEDTLAITKAYQDADKKLREEHQKQLEEQRLQARQRYGLVTFDEHIAKERAERKKSYEEGKLTKEEYEHSLTNLEFEAEQQRMQIRQQYGLASQQELYNAELAMLKQHLNNGLISQEEYEEAVKNMKIAKNKEAFDYYSNLAANAVTALQDAEIANMESQYDAEIEAARNAGKDTTELEKKKAEEKLKIQKKYADVNFAIKASQIIADTATSIMKAYADLGPIGGTIAAALMGVTGAAQLKAANAERQRIKKMTLNGSAGGASAGGTRVATGLETGGSIDVRREQDGKLFHAAYEPDRRGYVDRPTVIVGEGPRGQSREWVASHAAVENPTIAPVIDIIDRAQRAGTIRTLDMNKVLARQISGRASGGSIAQPSGNTQVNVSDTGRDALIERFYTLLEHLSTNGIPASVTLDDIDRMQKLRSQARSFGSK